MGSKLEKIAQASDELFSFFKAQPRLLRYRDRVTDWQGRTQGPQSEIESPNRLHLPIWVLFAKGAYNFLARLLGHSQILGPVREHKNKIHSNSFN